MTVCYIIYTIILLTIILPEIASVGTSIDMSGKIRHIRGGNMQNVACTQTAEVNSVLCNEL